jgi:hypothetical protein
VGSGAEGLCALMIAPTLTLSLLGWSSVCDGTTLLRSRYRSFGSLLCVDAFLRFL